MKTNEEVGKEVAQIVLDEISGVDVSALVVEKVLGWKMVDSGGNRNFGKPPDVETVVMAPSPAADANDCFDAVRVFCEKWKPPAFVIGNYGGEWCVTIASKTDKFSTNFAHGQLERAVCGAMLDFVQREGGFDATV